MSAVPETVEDAVPFGATVGAEADRPTLTARTSKAAPTELGAAPTEARPDLHHVMGVTAPVGPAGTLIDARAMGRALAGAPAMQTLLSADVAGAPALDVRKLVAEARAKAAPIARTPAPARNRALIAASAIVVLTSCFFAAAYLAATMLGPTNQPDVPRASVTPIRKPAESAALPSPGPKLKPSALPLPSAAQDSR